MHVQAPHLSGTTLATKPSTSFSTTSSTSNASKLLFGEIDLNSERSSASFHSACSLVLSTSSTFLRFWLSDDCRQTLLSSLPKQDLANLRLVCLDTSARTAPYLFRDTACTFKTSTFSKPARLAALDRIGHHVESLTFTVPHSPETFLPPLIDPWTGEEKAFVYKPQSQVPSTIIDKIKQPKYGDWETTDMLIRQYPPLFHAATNTAAFVRAFSSLVSLRHLTIRCPGQDVIQANRRSTVDYALMSLRTAVEQARPPQLSVLSLRDMHPSAVLHLSPLQGHGTTPNSSRCWQQIRDLDVHMHESFRRSDGHDSDQLRLVQDYLRNFSRLEKLHFRWIGRKGPSPLRTTSIRSDGWRTAKSEIQQSRGAVPSTETNATHPAHRTADQSVHYSHLRHLTLENAFMSSAQVQSLIQAHSRTLRNLDFESVSLVSGTWDEALSPLGDRPKDRHVRGSVEEVGDVPIMFEQPRASPSAVRPRPELQRQDSAVHFEPECDTKPRVLEKSLPPIVSLHQSPHRPVGKEQNTVASDKCGGAVPCEVLAVSTSKEGKKKRHGFWGREDIRRAFKGGLLHWR